jgi:hypothetical protein
MFIKGNLKYNKTTQEHYWVYKLCESYRINGIIRHHIISGLGKLEGLEKAEQRALLCSRIEEMIKGGSGTLELGLIDQRVEELARQFYVEIKTKKRYDVGKKKGEWETVNLKTLKNKDAHEIGAEWLCKQAFEQLGIAEFLRGEAWSDEKISLATTHIISRAVYPASELKTVSFVKENSAISELTGFDKSILTKDMLYRISHKLYSIKDKLENYLSKRTNELFDLEDKIILFDLTNTYYEGSMRGSKIAKYGRSKEKRSDAKLVVLAAVINREGFLKYTNIFEGNMADCETLQTIIEALSAKTSFTGRKPIVIIDAGIATEENLIMIRMKGYDYICVSRSSMKEYYADIESKPVEIKDKRKQPIELLKVKVADDNDNYLWVKSQAKGVKEKSMNGKLSQRFVEGIENINYGITKKGGTKKLEKVYERLGRLKQKYPSIHKYYEIIVADDGQGTATSVSLKRKSSEDAIRECGVYLLRTSLDLKDEQTFWTIYNIIREIEYTFRTLKTDLDLRPIYHKTDAASMAHLHLGLLAYWLVATIRFQLKQKGYKHDWSEIVRKMNTQKCVTTSVENIRDEEISVRQCTEPSENVKQIYDMLNYKYVPFTRKKSVVPPADFLKNENSHPQIITDG